MKFDKLTEAYLKVVKESYEDDLKELEEPAYNKSGQKIEPYQGSYNDFQNKYVKIELPNEIIDKIKKSDYFSAIELLGHLLVLTDKEKLEKYYNTLQEYFNS